VSTIKSSAENLTLNADGANNDIIFQSNGSNVATLDQAGLLTATTFAGSGASLTALPAANITGTLPAISGANLTGIEGVPTGVIAMWHGASGAIPSGWVICDGNNSTPNLTDKFIKSTGTANATGGGTTSGAHTLSESEIPSHDHDMTARNQDRSDVTDGMRSSGTGSNYGVDTGNRGGGSSHTHSQAEPVYFSLIFIMKT
jgi:microcystin-dependent protein